MSSDKDIAIRVENLSKMYRLGSVGTGTLSHDLNVYWHKLRGKGNPYSRVGEENNREQQGNSDYVWALRDINFEVKKGEILGIIGKNGAGKSTLLKILSRITGPTEGSIKVNGRMASLLEVGTGFHPELTGRENIYLNGAIMGMTKREITSKLEEIVDFSGCARYIDTPVKRYSSGMTVRLGFAVAAFLEPEILIVDEVLAVGDAEFQKKAIGKMQEVSRGQGRTVLFVSHNLQAISSLTNKSILMDKGQITKYDETTEVLKDYLSINQVNDTYIYTDRLSNRPIVRKIAVLTSHPNSIQSHGDVMSVIIEVETPGKIDNAALSFQIINNYDQPVCHVLNLNSEIPFCHQEGAYKLKFIFPSISLFPGNYHLKVFFADNTTKNIFEIIEDVCFFKVEKIGELRDFYWQQGAAMYVEKGYWEIGPK